MWKKIMEMVVKIFSSPVGKVIIMGGVRQYVRSNDNPLTHEVADAIEKML